MRSPEVGNDAKYAEGSKTGGLGGGIQQSYRHLPIDLSTEDAIAVRSESQRFSGNLCWFLVDPGEGDWMPRRTSTFQKGSIPAEWTYLPSVARPVIGGQSRDIPAGKARHRPSLLADNKSPNLLLSFS